MADTIFQILQWAIPSGGIGAAIAWIAEKKTRDAKTAKEVHDTYKAMYEDISALLVETQKKYEETKEQIETLGTENSRTRRALNRLSRAIEAIQICPHRANCPVSGELSLDEEADTGKQVRAKHRTDRQRACGHQRDESSACEGSNVVSESNTESGLPTPASSRSRIHSTSGTGESENKEKGSKHN